MNYTKRIIKFLTFKKSQVTAANVEVWHMLDNY
jgi:hypothetical protein